MTADQPIGVFDSGLGGLTVVREVIRRLPNEPLVYFGDTARLPYGPKSPETVVRYAREAARLLLEHEIKLLVVACNTATAHALSVLSAELSIPVVGVIEPGAREAVRVSRTGRIGVLGTVGTIDSGIYDRVLRRLRPDARIFAQPCPLFVPLVEEGFTAHEATRLIAEEYVKPLRDVEIDAVVLGCTHYPLLRPVLARVFGADVVLVDSARETAAEVEWTLESHDIFAPVSIPVNRRYFASDAPLRFQQACELFLGGGSVGRVEQANAEDYGAAA